MRKNERKTKEKKMLVGILRRRSENKSYYLKFPFEQNMYVERIAVKFSPCSRRDHGQQ